MRRRVFAAAVELDGALGVRGGDAQVRDATGWTEDVARGFRRLADAFRLLGDSWGLWRYIPSDDARPPRWSDRIDATRPPPFGSFAFSPYVMGPEQTRWVGRMRKAVDTIRAAVMPPEPEGTPSGEADATKTINAERWIKINDAARIAGLASSGVISRAVSTGTLKSNGLQGRARRRRSSGPDALAPGASRAPRPHRER